MESQAKRNYSMIIVDYNTIALTVEYIQYCKRTLVTWGNIEFIIIDNSEHGVGLEYLEQNYDLNPVKNKDNGQIYSFECDGISVYYYASYENLGYAKGNNLGAEISYLLFGDSILIFSNNDILFDGKLNLDIVGDKFINDVAVVGPDILEGSKHLNPMYKKDIMNCLYGNMIKALQSRIEDHYTFSGCFWFFDSFLFRQFGGFDPNTFLYFEEYIIEERIRQAGFKMLYCPDFAVIHNHDYKSETPQHFEKVSRQFLKSLCYYAREYKRVSNIKLGFIKSGYLIILKLFVLYKKII